MTKLVHRNTKYRSDWQKSFKWLQEVKDNPHSAKCTICGSDFRINSSGITQVRVHSESKRHQKLEKESLSIVKLLPDANNNISIKTSKLKGFIGITKLNHFTIQKNYLTGKFIHF